LEAALAEGEASGPPRPFDAKAFLKRMRAKRRRR
jgi:Arc/MetJ-type ribon-helix-helix transcriptional regulator